MASFYRREVLQQALGIIWQRKYLWFIGIFAGLASYGGEINFLTRSVQWSSAVESYLKALRIVFVDGTAKPYIDAIRRVIEQSPGQFSLSILIVILVGAAVLWLVILSQGSLTRIGGRAFQKKITGLTDGISTASGRFMDILQINLLGLLFAGAVWMVLMIMPAAIYLLTNTTVWAVVAQWGSYLALVGSAIILFLIQYAIAAVVLQDVDVLKALRLSLTTFSGNKLISLEMAVILFFVNSVVMLVVYGLAVALNLPFTLAGLIILLLATVLMLGMLTAFGYVAWAILYLKLLEGRARSKIGEWTTQLVSFSAKKPTV